MKIREIAKVLNAEVICCEDKLDSEVVAACASDMMSDVLAFVKDHSVLITGLNNPQVIRTAEMMDILCIVYVRGKKPDPISVKLAESKGIVLLYCSVRMFIACGLLYDAGLRGGEVSV
ncbi:MAG: DRTGG domain-containing protein [Clostridia bacterium]